MTQKTFPKPQPYHAGAAFLTLFEKEVLRFRKIALQTVLAPVIMGVMYLAVFGELLDDKMATFEGVTYTQFLVPGLVMMSLLQNSFANSASSLLQSKIMGSLVFIELPPFSGLQLAAAFIGTSVVRGLVVGIGVFIATFFWGRPMILSPLWVLAFAVLGAVLMASLGVICGLPGFAFFTDGVVPESSIWRSGSTGQDGAVKLFPAGNAASPGPGLPCEKRFRKNPQIFPEPDYKYHFI